MELALYIKQRPIREFYLTWAHRVSDYVPSKLDKRRIHEWRRVMEEMDPLHGKEATRTI